MFSVSIARFSLLLELYEKYFNCAFKQKTNKKTGCKWLNARGVTHPLNIDYVSVKLCAIFLSDINKLDSLILSLLFSRKTSKATIIGPIL